MKCNFVFRFGWENYPDLTLKQTCSACPEQYDVLYKNKPLGYLRLRSGKFRADYLRCGGKTVYEASPKGDGEFESSERNYFLDKAVYYLLKERKRAKKSRI